MDWSKLSVLVTGGTGSFGRKLVEILIREHSPRRIIVFSRDEVKQSEMAQAMPHGALRFFLGDVRDKARLMRAFDGVDIVVHAAALKQVPSGEYNPSEVVHTNVLGAENVIDAAIDCGVERIIALSTDKAANPINLYGATKLCSDKLFIAGNAYAAAHPTRFSVVRYGNVINSRGSVVPYFRKLRGTGAIPITDPRMTRFVITLDQGARFVLKCLESMGGGEIFVPKIPSTTILDLAEVIAPGCRHEIIGIRPGEKLHEVMVPEDDSRRTLEFDDLYVIEPDFPWWEAKHWDSGRRVQDRFCYSSDTNPWKLDRDELRRLVGEEQ